MFKGTVKVLKLEFNFENYLTAYFMLDTVLSKITVISVTQSLDNRPVQKSPLPAHLYHKCCVLLTGVNPRERVDISKG